MLRVPLYTTGSPFLPEALSYGTRWLAIRARRTRASKRHTCVELTSIDVASRDIAPTKGDVRVCVRVCGYGRCEAAGGTHKLSPLRRLDRPLVRVSFAPREYRVQSTRDNRSITRAGSKGCRITSIRVVLVPYIHARSLGIIFLHVRLLRDYANPLG